MGKPAEPERFVPLVVGEWGRRYGTVYVAREIWDKLRPMAQDLRFYLDDGSCCRLSFEVPKERLRA